MEYIEEAMDPEAEKLSDFFKKYISQALDEKWESIDKGDRWLLQNSEGSAKVAVGIFIHAHMHPKAGASPKEAVERYLYATDTVMFIQHKLETPEAITLEMDLEKRREHVLEFLAENAALLYPHLGKEELMKKASERFKLPLEQTQHQSD